MAQTLRRELRNKFLERLNWMRTFSALDIDDLAEKLTDDALSVAGIANRQPKTVEVAIYADVPVTDQMLQPEKGFAVVRPGSLTATAAAIKGQRKARTQQSGFRRA